MANKFVELTVGTLGIAAVCAGTWYLSDYSLAKRQREVGYRMNRETALAALPSNGTGPVQQAEADTALEKLQIQEKLAPVALAYELDAGSRMGCVVVSSQAHGQTAPESKAKTIAKACAEAGAAYHTDLAKVAEMEKQPHFWKTPFKQSYYLASSAIPPGASEGAPSAVLPLLEKAKFPADKEVAIVSWSYYDKKTPATGCILVGKMGMFKASSSTEVDSCVKVIALAQAAKA